MFGLRMLSISIADIAVLYGASPGTISAILRGTRRQAAHEIEFAKDLEDRPEEERRFYLEGVGATAWRPTPVLREELPDYGSDDAEQKPNQDAGRQGA